MPIASIGVSDICQLIKWILKHGGVTSSVIFVPWVNALNEVTPSESIFQSTDNVGESRSMERTEIGINERPDLGDEKIASIVSSEKDERWRKIEAMCVNGKKDARRGSETITIASDSVPLQINAPSIECLDADLEPKRVQHTVREVISVFIMLKVSLMCK